MAKVAPYHTTTPEDQFGRRNVYHDHDNCPDGKRIRPQNKVQGTAGRPRYDECKKLG